jgi:hypothetical protein
LVLSGWGLGELLAFGKALWAKPFNQFTWLAFFEWYATTDYIGFAIRNFYLNRKARIGVEVNRWAIAKGLFVLRPVTAIGFPAFNAMVILATLKSFPRFGCWCSVLLEHKLFAQLGFRCLSRLGHLHIANLYHNQHIFKLIYTYFDECL